MAFKSNKRKRICVWKMVSGKNLAFKYGKWKRIWFHIWYVEKNFAFKYGKQKKLHCKVNTNSIHCRTSLVKFISRLSQFLLLTIFEIQMFSTSHFWKLNYFPLSIFERQILYHLPFLNKILSATKIQIFLAWSFPEHRTISD